MPARPTSKRSPISLYVLRLAEEKYYVGQARNPAQRIEDHFRGNGSSWTQLHKPVEVVKILETNASTWRAAVEIETFLTLELMKIYGWQNVRGGSYTASTLACAPVSLRDPKCL